jgi:hypothetical protein
MVLAGVVGQPDGGGGRRPGGGLVFLGVDGADGAQQLAAEVGGRRGGAVVVLEGVVKGGNGRFRPVPVAERDRLPHHLPHGRDPLVVAWPH